jgi:putative ABC transport system permease protein
MLNDLTFALRSLKRAAGLTTASVLVLGLGIGGTAAIYSVVDSLIVHPLAIRELGRVVAVWDNLPATGFAHDEASAPDFLDWRSQSHSFAHLAAIGYRTFNLTGRGRPQQIIGAAVTSDFFDVLGARALIGRTFTAADDQPSNRVAILSARLWAEQFGADSSIIGRPLSLNGLPYTVVGIAPPGVEYPAALDIWTPLATADLSRQPRRAHYLLVIGRLALGVTVAAARSELTGIAARLTAAYASTNTGHSIFLAPLRDDAARNVAPALFVLGAAMIVLLLIACTNVSNLLLTRAASRHAELALRSSLGATRWRLIRQLLAEALVLAGGGGFVGALVAAGGVRAAKAMIPAQQGQFMVGYQTLHVDPRVVLAAALLSLVTAVAIGVLPAFHASRPRLVPGVRSTADRRSSRTRSAFVVAEVSLALLLLIGAGLMVKSYGRLIAVQPGFLTDRVVTADVALPSARYPDSTSQIQFWNNVLVHLRSSPGIVAAGATSNAPLCGCNQTTSFTIVGAPTPAPGNVPESSYQTIVPGYFGALGIPVVRGRDLDAHDGVGVQRVVVVNDAFVARFLTGRDPLTTRLALDTLAPIGIVGVVGNVRHFGLDQPAPPEIYLPMAEVPAGFMSLVVQTRGDARTAIPAIRAAVAAVDPDQPLARVMTMDEAAQVSRYLQSLALELLLAFAGVAALLAVIGIYGVISYSVGQRTREIGIRAALGAQPRELLRLIVAQGSVPVSVGVGLGLVVAAVTTRALGALLYGVSPTDVPTFAAVAGALGVVGLIASGVPALRAARVDPVVALRSE